VGGILVVLLVPVAIVVLPILTHQNQGSANQPEPGEQWPLSVTATGDDGRTRVLEIVSDDEGGPVETDALVPGDRLIVSGSGFDPDQGIYVAICKIPVDASTKPGPCLGGIPEQTEQQSEPGAIEYAPSNWINDDWAWKLFGARSFDDRETGTFTAYIEVAEPTGEGVDCRVDACGLYTRNDHTALSDRVQDLYLPVAIAG
jgi:hypothetical protein